MGGGRHRRATVLRRARLRRPDLGRRRSRVHRLRRRRRPRQPRPRQPRDRRIEPVQGAGGFLPMPLVATAAGVADGMDILAESFAATA